VAAAPHTDAARIDPGFVTGRGLCNCDQFVEHRPQDPRLEPPADPDVGSRLPPFAVKTHLQRMLGIQGYLVVDIGAERQGVSLSGARGINLNGRKRRIIDADSGPFHRRYKPIVAVIFSPQYGGKQLHQWFAANRRTMIEPCTVMADAHVDIAAELLTDFIVPLGGGWAGAQTLKGAADRG